MSQITVIFGGSGFIGTHYIRRLAREGQKVLSVDLLPPRERLDGVEYQIGDVRKLKDFSLPANTERILNFAAVHKTPGHPDHEYYNTNIGGAIEVTGLASRKGIKEIIFTSSISVYGSGEETKTEEALLTPNSAYGYSKMLAERVHQEWMEGAEDRRLIIARPGVVFGEGERGNFTRLAAMIRKGVFVFPGRRDAIKACIYVADLIAALEFARSGCDRVVVFNGVYEQRYSLEQIVEVLTSRYFPNTKTIQVPLPIVMLAARTLRMLDLFGLGIDPDRVTKLVRSTDVYPGWLSTNGLTFPGALEHAVERWYAETSGRLD
jgi:nucleoside-diphosphate-sugar epimerase